MEDGGFGASPRRVRVGLVLVLVLVLILIIPRNRHDLIVADVIVRLVDTPAVPWPPSDFLVAHRPAGVVLAQAGQEMRLGFRRCGLAVPGGRAQHILDIRHHDLHGPPGVAAGQVQVAVDAHSTVDAFPLGRAGETVCCWAGGRWFAGAPELSQRTGGGDAARVVVVVRLRLRLRASLPLPLHILRRG